MNPRMISPWKRPNSANYWFRLAVPGRYREFVGQVEIKLSLQTADVREARRLCGLMQCEWLAKFQSYDIVLAAKTDREAVETVERFLNFEAAQHGGLDGVVAHELEGLGLAEECYLDAEPDEDRCCGTPPNGLTPPNAEEPYSVYRAPMQRQMIAERRELFANNPRTRLLAGREAAERALGLQFWQIASAFIDDASSYVGRPLSCTSPGYAAAAEHYLRRVLDHQLEQLQTLPEAWPLPAAISPPSASTAPASPLPTSITAAPVATSIGTTSIQPAPNTRPQAPARGRLFPVAVEGRTITSVFGAWAAAQPATAAKLCDEWGVAIRRFVELFGEIDVSEIDGDMVADFRDAMHRLPSRPKRDIGALPLMEQIVLICTEV